MTLRQFLKKEIKNNKIIGVDVDGLLCDYSINALVVFENGYIMTNFDKKIIDYLLSLNIYRYTVRIVEKKQIEVKAYLDGVRKKDGDIFL